MKACKYSYQSLVAILALFFMVACGGGNVVGFSGGGGSGISSLMQVNADQMSAIPLIDGKSAIFYYYFANNSEHSLNGLNWTVKTLYSNDSTAIQIIDQSECKNVAPNQSCRIKLLAQKPVAAQVAATVNGQKLQLDGGDGVIYALKLKAINTGDLADALTFSPIGHVYASSDGWAYDLFLINNSHKPIFLNPQKILDRLPLNVSVTIGSCKNPLPYGEMCQIRLKAPANIAKNMDILLTSKGLVKNSGVELNLPHQNNLLMLHTSSSKVTNFSARQIWLNNIRQNNGATAKYISPVVTPGLDIDSDLFASNLGLKVTESTSYVVRLTNNSSANLSGLDLSVFVNVASLIPNKDPYAVYSVDTNNITDSPCTVSATMNNNFFIPAGKYCNYHLNITAKAATAATGIIKSWNYKYSYASPTSGQLVSAPNILTDNFNLTITQSLAQLSTAVAPGYSGNEFNNVPMGVPNPSLQLIIQNTGGDSINGALSIPLLPSFMTATYDPACTNLAAMSSCLATITMSTSQITAKGNLNTTSMRYNNQLSDVALPLPDVVYQVVPLTTPQIDMEAYVSGGKCFVGDGIGSPCYANPDSTGGDASKLIVNLEFTNNSTNVPVSSLTLSNASLNLFSIANYTLLSDTCSSGILPNGSCIISYNIASTAKTGALQPNISQGNFTYKVQYGGSPVKTQNENSALDVQINVVMPSLTIGSLSGALAGSGNSSSNFVVTLSDLYQSTLPTLTGIVNNGAGANMNPKVTANIAACYSTSKSSAHCDGSVVTANPAVGAYTLIVNGGALKNTLPFNIVSPIMFLTFGGYSGNLGGLTGADSICQSEASLSGSQIPSGLVESAILISPDRYPCDANGNCANPLSWPLSPNFQYNNTVGSGFMSSNSNGVFSGNNSLIFYDVKGQKVESGVQFWLGIQSIKINSTNSDINAWAWYNVNESSNKYWPRNNANCLDYTSSDSGKYVGNYGITGVKSRWDVPFEPYATPFPNQWGNWYYFSNTNPQALFNVWSASSVSLFTTCDTEMRVLCVAR